MAFFGKVRGVLQHSITMNMAGELSASTPTMFQARCMSSKIFVGGLSPETTEDILRQTCEKYGEVLEARIIYDLSTGNSKGYGFITYKSDEAANYAITGLQGQWRVNHAHDRTQRGGRGNFGGGGGGYNNSGSNQGGSGGYYQGGSGGYQGNQGGSYAPGSYPSSDFPFAGPGMRLVEPEQLFKELMEAKANANFNKKCLLGLDFGDKYIGVAILDVNSEDAKPLITMSTPPGLECNGISVDWKSKAEELQSLVSQYSVMGLVVGIPFKLRQREIETHYGLKIKQMVNDINATRLLGDISYAFWNESFSSRIAELWLGPMDKIPRDVKRDIDMYAAAAILQDFWDVTKRVHGKDQS